MFDSAPDKINVSLLYNAIEDENLELLNQYIDQIPIDYPITDTGMTAFSFACFSTKNP